MTVAHARLALDWHAIGCRGVEVGPLNHGVWIAKMAVVMLLVRTLIIHVPSFSMVGLTLCKCGGIVGPVAAVGSVLGSDGCAHLVGRVG